MSQLAQELLNRIKDPAWSLPRFGKIMGQKKQGDVLYNPYAITRNLQATLVSYYSNTPRNAYGQTFWLTLVAYRQGGKSLTPELCGYVKAAYNPGFEHVCIADNKDRAEYLHTRVHYTHENWPKELRTPTAGGRHEVRQKTFKSGAGGRMRVLSGHAGAVGIGQSPDSFHGSELPYYADAESQFSLIYPSMGNRDDALVVLESTAAPSDEPSAEWWQDEYSTAKKNTGDWGNRKIAAFFPYWDGLLNARGWPKNAALDADEISLLGLHGYEATLQRKLKEYATNPKYRGLDHEKLAKAHLISGTYLSKENLAFRRFMIETDKKIRKNPELFWTYYPKDDLSCWLVHGNSVIHWSLIKKHERPELIEWESPYVEYEAPEPGAIYVLGVDPVGFAARDHAAIQVLKVYDGEWTQVACYAAHTAPLQFAPIILRIAKRYNNALIGVESNGVGNATLALLIQAEYRRIYYEKAYKPGITASASANDMMLAHLQDALLDCLILWDKDTVRQLKTYRHDKRVERSPTLEMLNPKTTGSRRERHHWDKISALMIAVRMARASPRKLKPVTNVEQPKNVVLYKDLTWNQIQEYRKKQAALLEGTKPRRRTYRRKRRK